MDSRTAASSALRAAASACALAGGLTADAPLGWVPAAVRPLLEGAADLIFVGPGWGNPHRGVVANALREALEAVPEVKDHEAADIGDGAIALVSVVRRWVA